MKYPGRALLLFFTITACLYGTKEIWDEQGYNAWARVASMSEPVGYKRSDAQARSDQEQRAARDLRETMTGGY